MLTCVNCLAGKTYKCVGKTCARWGATHTDIRSKLPRTTTRNVPVRPRNGSNTEDSTFVAEQHAIARMLIDGILTSAEIARVMHCSYGKVRNVFSKLQILASEVTRV